MRRTVLILRSLAQMICALTLKRFFIRLSATMVERNGNFRDLCCAMRPRIARITSLCSELRGAAGEHQEAA